jgi:hypothetical protein
VGILLVSRSKGPLALGGTILAGSYVLPIGGLPIGSRPSLWREVGCHARVTIGAYMHIHIHMNIYHLLLAQPTDVTGIWPCFNPIIDVSSFPWRFERYNYSPCSNTPLRRSGRGEHLHPRLHFSHKIASVCPLSPLMCLHSCPLSFPCYRNP